MVKTLVEPESGVGVFVSAAKTPHVLRPVVLDVVAEIFLEPQRYAKVD